MSLVILFTLVLLILLLLFFTYDRRNLMSIHYIATVQLRLSCYILVQNIILF